MTKHTALTKLHVLELVELARLKPYPRNPRIHSRTQIQRLANSIAEFGFTNPVLIDEANVVIAGHGRIDAAKLLQMRQLPAYRLTGLSEAQKIALRIADNRIAEQSSWSADALAGELQLLIDADFSVELTGFDTIDLDRLLTPEAADAGENEPPIPPCPANPVSRPGDIWQLGRHSLICASALDKATLRQLLGDRIADLVLTDPPYNVPIPGHVSGQSHHKNFAMASGEMSEAEFGNFLSTALCNARDHARDGSLHYVFIDWRSVGLLLSLGGRIFDRLMNLCVWAKTNAGMGSFYRSQHELIAVFKKGSSAHVNNVQLGRLGRNRSNLWQHVGASSFSKSRDADLAEHPTVKPTALLIDAIRDATAPGDLVLDPFGGSGSTLLAAELSGRTAALAEIEPAYVDVILQRFQTMTGIEPLLLPDLIPLSQVRMHRSPTQENGHV